MITTNGSRQKTIELKSYSKTQKNRSTGIVKFLKFDSDSTFRKVMHISGEKTAKINFMSRVIQSDLRQMIIESMHANHITTLTELSKTLKLNKVFIYQNIVILKRIGVAKIVRKGRQAGFILDYKKLHSIDKYNSKNLVAKSYS